MLSIIQNIPNVNTYPLTYVFENIYFIIFIKSDT